MSKRQLSQFLETLSKKELQEQLIDLYQRFKQVKTFYDFSFNPQEDKLFQEAKIKISREYFPDTSRKAKKRRSIPQKWIIHLQKLEADPSKIADLMLYQIEVAQRYTAEKTIRQEAFYKSMLKSFRHAIVYINHQFLLAEFKERLNIICRLAEQQEWFNAEGFKEALNMKIN